MGGSRAGKQGSKQSRKKIYCKQSRRTSVGVIFGGYHNQAQLTYEKRVMPEQKDSQRASSPANGPLYQAGCQPTINYHSHFQDFPLPFSLALVTVFLLICPSIPVSWVRLKKLEKKRILLNTCKFYHSIVKHVSRYLLEIVVDDEW